MTENGMSYIQVILPLKLDWVPFYKAPSDNVRVGDKVRVMFAGKEYVGVVSSRSDSLPCGLDPGKVHTIVSVENSLAGISHEELDFWSKVGGYYLCSIGEVYRTAFPARRLAGEQIQARKAERIAARLAKDEEARKRKTDRLSLRIEKVGKLLAGARRDDTRSRYAALLSELELELETVMKEPAAAEAATAKCELPELSQLQRTAVAGIHEAFDASKTVLLHGVTGSGKTEIYCTLARETLEAGKNVLYLVPEIAMSRQLEQRLERVFGDRLLVFHSHESVSRRSAVADRLESGEDTTVVLGTRSALFLPHRKLGLVIVDEEHDSSYKQDSPAPRYNGRDAALMLASSHKGCNVVLGSATPSLESLYNCSTGKYARIPLDTRFHGAEDAEIEIIDTIAERRKNGMVGSYSRKLIDRIAQTLMRGEQVMVLRSRRSYSPLVQCRECGDIPRCPRCNVSLSLHKDEGGGSRSLVCHHCGYRVRNVSGCSKCGGEYIGFGAGTQKLEEEAKSLFPGARIERLDSDTAQRKGYEEDVIRRFSEGGTDILVGTQMLAKGFDFDKLSLVAVMQADALLAQEDFRADEKALQLLRQFRGRCGRRGNKGLLVIQTSRADHPLYATIDGCDNGGRLLAERRLFGYPPYRRIVILEINDIFDDRAERSAQALKNSILTAADRFTRSGDIEIAGPYTPPGSADGHFSRRLRLCLRRNRNLAAAKEAVLQAVRDFERNSKAKVTIDVDPA